MAVDYRTRLTVPIVQKTRSENHFAFFQRVEKPFSARWQTVKKVPEAEQLAPVGVHRYGRARVATEVKILAEQAELQQNRYLYVILRNAVTKNLFSFDTAKILRVRSG